MKQLGMTVLACLAMAACGGAGASSQPTSGGGPEKTSLKMGVGGQSQIVYLPATLADSLGYYRAEGISVEIDELKGGSDALKALLGGSGGIVAGLYEAPMLTEN